MIIKNMTLAQTHLKRLAQALIGIYLLATVTPALSEATQANAQTSHTQNTQTEETKTQDPIKVFRWKNAQGNYEFSDQSTAENSADILELKPATVLNFPKAPSNRASKVNGADRSPNNYTSLTITTPSNEATVRSDIGQVIISLQSIPSLQTGHTIQFYLNGQALGAPQSQLSRTLNNVDRGSHTISASILGQRGKTLIQSSSSFHLHRARVPSP